WHLKRRFYVVCSLLALCATPYFYLPTSFLAPVVFPLACGLALWTFYEFIPEVRLWGPFPRALTWSLSVLLAGSAAALFWLPQAGGAAGYLFALALIGFLVAYLAVLTHLYLPAGPLGRRQIKWIVFGSYVAILPQAACVAVYLLNVWPEWWRSFVVVTMIASVAGPLGILAAIAFYQFLDIDRLFSSTLSYSVLAIVAIALVLGVLPTASRAASFALGIAPASGQFLAALG